MAEEAAFALFKTYMLEKVIPEQLEGAVSSNEEAMILIKSQWDEMPTTEKETWKAKVEEPVKKELPAPAFSFGSSFSFGESNKEKSASPSASTTAGPFSFTAPEPGESPAPAASTAWAGFNFGGASSGFSWSGSSTTETSESGWNLDGDGAAVGFGGSGVFGGGAGGSSVFGGGSGGSSVFGGGSGGSSVFGGGAGSTAFGSFNSENPDTSSSKPKKTRKVEFSESDPPKIKLVLAGDGGVGKSVFIKKFKTGEFETKYIPTIGVEVTPIELNTNRGKVTINCWDTAGQEKFGGLRDGYYIMSEALIIMFDLTARVTYKNVPNWYRDVTRVWDHDGYEGPVVLVGNKVDTPTRTVQPKEITFHRKKSLQYYDMSVKSNYNLEKPFLYILRRMSGDPTLSLVNDGKTDVTPPEIQLDAAAIEAATEELQRASLTQLAEEDDF